MEITIIGVITIILSIIAFIKNEDWLLGLIVFFSTFTAAVAIDIHSTTTAILPFEIPLILWIIKQFFNFIKYRPKINKEVIKSTLKNNKIFTALLIFTILLIISEIWLLISGLNYSYYDTLFFKDNVLTFSMSNITQVARIVIFLFFAMLLSLKINSKEKIKKLLKIFVVSSICAVIWGLIQYMLYLLNITYPADLFNNNPYYSQGYNQHVGRIKRISSIATEPSVFALNLLAFIPILFVNWLFFIKSENRYKKTLLVVVMILTIVCAILTTSSTIFIGLFVLSILILLCIMFSKSLVIKERIKASFKFIVIIGTSIIIACVLILVPLISKNFNDLKVKVDSKTSVTNAVQTVNNINNTKVSNNYNIAQKVETNNEAIVSESKNNNIENDNKKEIIKNSDNKVENANKVDTTQSVKNDNKETVNKKENSIFAIFNEGYKSFISTMKQLTIDKLNTASGQQRLTRDALGLELFSKSPVFGIGFGSFRTFNLFTNVLVNVGVLGIISLIYILYVTIKAIIVNRKKDKKFALIFLMSILGMTIAFLISIPDLIYIYYWIILVMAYKYFTVEDDKIEVKSNKKIGIDARGLNGKGAGISTYIEQVVKQINSLKDDDNEYVLYSNREINIDFELKENIKIRECNKPIGTFWLYFLLPKMLKEDNIDIFWGTQHCLPMRNYYTKSIKYVVTIHDLAIHKFKHVGEFKNILIQRIFVKKSCKCAELIIADSKATKMDLKEIFGVAEDKINVVYLGTNFTDNYNISLEDEKEILEKFKIEDKNYLFFVSTIEPRKNIITLVKAFEQLKENGNKELKLILSGGLGWRYEDILSAIENSKYRADINLTGYITKQEKACLFRNAKCFVYPSLYEGFGLPILEAMANNSLVVTSHISSIPEVGKDVASYFYDVYNYNELANVIIEVLNMEEAEKESRIKLGVELTREFTWEKCAKKIKSILEN